jgi:hypothetical protein
MHKDLIRENFLQGLKPTVIIIVRNQAGIFQPMGILIKICPIMISQEIEFVEKVKNFHRHRLLNTNQRLSRLHRKNSGTPEIGNSSRIKKLIQLPS